MMDAWPAGEQGLWRPDLCEDEASQPSRECRKTHQQGSSILCCHLKNCRHLLAINHLLPEDDQKKEAAKAAHYKTSRFQSDINRAPRPRGVEFYLFTNRLRSKGALFADGPEPYWRPEIYLEFLRESKASRNLYNEDALFGDPIFSGSAKLDFLCQTIFRPFLSKKPGRFLPLGSGLRSGEEAVLHGDMAPGHLGGKASAWRSRYPPRYFKLLLPGPGTYL